MRRVIKGAQIAGEHYLVAAAMARSEALAGAQPGDASEPQARDGNSAADTAELDAARERAYHVIQEARERGAAMVEEARARSEALIDETAQAAAALREQARISGHDEGLREGRRTAQEELAQAAAALRGIVESAREQRRAVIAAAEPEIVRLALLVAQRVIHREIEGDPRVVVDVARAAIAHLSDKETMVVRVNPGDLEIVRAAREELFPGDARPIRFVGDLRVDRGGVVIDTEAGSVDAKIEHQLQEARRLLRLDDDGVTLDRRVSTEGMVGHAEAS
ncbi:hypothetical protein EPN52_02255 [bacterium]|nr:MAG: hypothetical protein EPN52_02255 [bacterium]